MYYESVITKPKKISFDNFIKSETYKITNGDIKIYDIPTILNPNSLKNIFVYNNHEFNILKEDENVYKLTIYKPKLHLSSSSNILKFGCELETCLNLSCIDPMTKEIKEMYKKLQDTKDEIIWKDIIIIYIQKVILKNASLEFKRIFPQICIAIYPKNNLINYSINTSTGVVTEANIVNFNDYITFTRDSSLICGDNIKNTNKTKYEYINENTIHCEIITPTLNNIDELELLFDLIVNPMCLNYNSSTSFHVNISFEKQIYFSFGFCDELIKEYHNFEKRNYRLKEKQKFSSYAIPLFDMMIKNVLYDIGSIIYYDNKKTYHNKSEIFLDKGYYRSYIDFNEKYSSLFCKSNRLIEFRLFSSDNVLKNLMDYLRESIILLKNGYENYKNNFHNGFIEFQNINLKTGIDFNILEYYVGPLYSVNPNFPEYEKIDSLEDTSLESSLRNLFSKRHQIFYDITPMSVRVFKIRTIKNGETYNYAIRKGTKDNFIIEPIMETNLV